MEAKFYIKLKSGILIGMTAEQLKRYVENKDKPFTPEQEAKWEAIMQKLRSMKTLPDEDPS